MRSANQRPVIAASRFWASDEGSVGVIFGLALLPFVMMVGAAIDYTRMATMRSGLQQATDSAVLAVATKITATTTTTQAQAQAQVRLNSNWRMASAQIDSVSISDDKQTFCVNSRISVPMTFMKLTGVQALNPSVTACASLAGRVDPNTTYEIALVLDNSGSMTSSAGGVSKMQALKDALVNNQNTGFVQTMYSKSSNVKMSIAPFAAGVVALDPTDVSSRNHSWIDKQGNNSQHWITFGGKTAANAAGFTSRFDLFDKLKTLRTSWDWGGCLEQPVYPKNVNDTTPSPSDAETLFVPYLASDEPSDDNDYGNSYLNDSGGSCGSVSGEWNKLTRTCKYVSPVRSYDGGGPNSHCPNHSTQTIMQLTPTQSTVTSKIGQLVASGYTNLHEGFMWGWRTLSPNLPFAGGRSYNAPNNRKIIVFMTDGFNNWASQTSTATGSTHQAAGYYSYNGVANARFPDGTLGNNINYQNLLKVANNTSTNYHGTSRNMQDELTLEACTNAKAAGIEVFTIGFSTPTDPIDTQGLNLMKACATNVEHYFAAADADQLNAAFTQIGIGLGKLRLSK
jgi:Flp pilus assembly protein TadG